MHTHFLAAMAITALLAGCAAPTTKRVEVTSQQTTAEERKQLDLAAEDLVAEQVRLHRVHWQVITSSTALCPKLTRAPGMYTMVLPKGDMAETMSRLYGVTKQPTVMAVAPGSPADKAGVKPRDVVLSVWGLPTSGDDLKAIRERSRTAKAGETMPVRVRRDGELLDLAIEPMLACDYPAAVSPEQVLNAYADGERIYITRGMMAFARTDEELALVLSHEMAHNSMKHMDAKRVNAALGTAADLALMILTKGAYNMSALSSLASQSHSQEFEAEADYVGLYMLANSGYSIQDAPKFWRRMAMASPSSIKGSHAASHPPTSYRMVALEEAAKEIEGKKLAMAALVPMRKDGKPFVAGDATMMAAAPTLSLPPAAITQGNARGGQGGGVAVASAEAAAAKEVVGCVPQGTRAGDKLTLKEWGVVQVKSLANGGADCGANAATTGTVTATFVQVQP